MMHANYYEQRLGPDITRQMALWVQQGDPAGRAVRQRLRRADRQPARRLRVAHPRTARQGVPIGGIGVQGHLHGDSFDPDALQNALDKLAALRLPIRVTEFNMPGQRSKFLPEPPRSTHRRTGGGQGQGADRLLPHLLRPPGRRRHPHVGLLGRGQLDSRLLPVPARLDAHARRPRLSRPGVPRVVDRRTPNDRRRRPVAPAPFSANIASRPAIGRRLSS